MDLPSKVHKQSSTAATCEHVVTSKDLPRHKYVSNYTEITKNFLASIGRKSSISFCIDIGGPKNIPCHALLAEVELPIFILTASLGTQ